MRFIVDFLPETTEEFISSYFETNSCTIVEELCLLGQTYLVESDTHPPLDGIENVIPDVSGAISLLSTTTKTFPIDENENWWKVAVIDGVDYDADTVEIVRAGQGVRVYVLDSGIDLSHPEFAGKDITLLHSKTGEFSDTTGHGTAIASVIVGETCGITEASLRVVKLFAHGHPTTLGEVLTALQKVAEDFALDASKPAVLNLSWAIDKNLYVESKLAALMAMGIVVVCAAGNSGTAVQNVTPASMESAITVGSFGPTLVPSNFTNYTGPSNTSYTEAGTNYGVGLDIFAPGETIRVALPGGGYGYSAGTSIAAAIMSAVSVLNLAIINPTYEFRGYDVTLVMLRQHFMNNGFLALEAPYDTSPNSIPRVRITAYDPSVEEPRVAKALATYRASQPFALRLFDAPFFSDAEIVDAPFPGVTVEGNYLTGTTPAATAEVFRGSVTVTDGTTTATIPIEIFVYDPQVYEDTKAAYQDANYVLLECGCGAGVPCCGYCDKVNSCDECAYGYFVGGEWMGGGGVYWMCH